MAYNKVMDKLGNILIDLTNDTVTENDVRQGKIFHNRSGDVKFGTLKVELDENITVDTDLYGDPEKFNDVIFFDALGRVVVRYTLEDARNLTELPPLPVIEEEGLTGVCWNHTLEDLKKVKHPTVVGACYKTSDDTTQITIDYTYTHTEQAKIYAYASSSYPTTVDWGDGTVEQFTTYPFTHYYSTPGIYTVKLRNHMLEESTSKTIPDIFFGGSVNSNYLMGTSNANLRVLKLKISKDFTKFRDGWGFNLNNLQLLTFEGWHTFKNEGKFPNEFRDEPSLTNPKGCFTGRGVTTSSLKSVSYPRGTVMGSSNDYEQVTYDLNNMYVKKPIAALHTVKIDFGGLGAAEFTYSTIHFPAPVLPSTFKFYNITFENFSENTYDSFPTVGGVFKIRATNVTHLEFPEGVSNSYFKVYDKNNYISSLGYSVPPSNTWDKNYLNNMVGIREFEMPNNVTAINTSCLAPNLRVLKFTSFEDVPNLYNSAYMSLQIIIVVPDNLVESFKTATNWAALTIYGESEYNNLIQTCGDFLLRGEI